MQILNEIPRDIKKGQWVSLDTEFFGQNKDRLHRPHGTFACISIAVEGRAELYQLYDTRDLKKLFLSIKNAQWVFHNALYDIRQLRQFTAIEPRPIWDTMLVEQSMFGGYYQNFSLKDLVRRYLGIVMDKEVRGEFSEATEMSPDMKTYAAKDAVLTLRVARAQYDRHYDAPGFKACADIDEPMIFPILDMKGTLIDANAWTKTTNEFQDTATKLQDELGINVNSQQQVLKACAAAGIHMLDTKAATLEQYKDVELIANILKTRMYRKAVSTYGLKWLENNVEADGKVYSSWHITGAETGRMASSSPNLQNIPQRKLPVFRTFFVASPGNRFIVDDVCLEYGTRILTTDLRWIPIENLGIGDSLIAPEEYPTQFSKGDKPQRHLIESKVQKHKTVFLPSLRLTMSNGKTVTCSKDHQWLVWGAGGYNWKRSEDLVLGDKLQYYVDPWKEDTSNEGGWLAGLFDGEGTVSGGGLHTNGARKGSTLSISQLDGAVMTRIVKELSGRGFGYTRYEQKSEYSKTKTPALHITGVDNCLRLLGQIRPIRLLQKSKIFWEGRMPKGSPINVVDIEDVGEKRLIAMQTSSKTYIAEGILTHNCQQEPCILAYESKDRILTQAIVNGEDLHLTVARAIFNDPSMEKSNPLRSVGKTINLGLSYGLSAHGLAARQNLSLEQAEGYIQQYFNRFSGVFAWVGQMRQQAFTNGFVKTASGRRIYMNLYNNQWQNNAINAPIQGGAADFTKMWVRKYWEKCNENGLDYSLCLIVHDEIGMDVPKEQVRETNRIRKEAFNETAETLFKGIPFKSEAEQGRSWACKSIKEEMIEDEDEQS